MGGSIGLNINEGAAKKLEKTFEVEKEESDLGLDEILELKKKPKEMASIY